MVIWQYYQWQNLSIDFLCSHVQALLLNHKLSSMLQEWALVFLYTVRLYFNCTWLKQAKFHKQIQFWTCIKKLLWRCFYIFDKMSWWNNLRHIICGKSQAILLPPCGPSAIYRNTPIRARRKVLTLLVKLMYVLLTPSLLLSAALQLLFLWKHITWTDIRTVYPESIHQRLYFVTFYVASFYIQIHHYDNGKMFFSRFLQIY